MIRCCCLLIAGGALGACTSEPPILGRWIWEGGDCASRHLEIARQHVAIVENAERTILFNVKGGKSPTGADDRYVLSLEPAAAISADDRIQGPVSILFRIEGDRLAPRTIEERGEIRTLSAEEPVAQMFTVLRCS